jgi:ribose transport system permease protein
MTSNVVDTTSNIRADEARLARRQRIVTRLLLFVARYGTLILLAGMIVFFGVKAPSFFLTVSNFENVLNSASLVAIVAAGLTLTLVVGEFDLSVGYSTSFSGVVVVCFMSYYNIPLVFSLILVMICGTGVGVVNGLLVTKVRINAVIATLGVGTILGGLEYIFAPTPIVNGIPASFTKISLGRAFLTVPNPVWVMCFVLIILWIVLNKTDLGLRMQAVGGNIEAARLAGIRVDRVKLFAFAAAGACAALTGFLLSSLLGSGTIGAGDGYLLQAFAAVFLGSATLRNGEFHIFGTLVGVLIICLGFNGLSIINAPTAAQPIFEGISLVLAVGLSTVAQRYANTIPVGSQSKK